MVKINTIANQLFAGALFIVLLSGVLSAFSFLVIRNIQQSTALGEKIRQANDQFNEIGILKRNFLLYESRQPELFETGISFNLKRIQRASDSINQIFLSFHSHTTSTGEMGVGREEVAGLQQTLKEYMASLGRLEKLTLQKGFKDWGKIGQLREAIHRVESLELDYDKTYMLMLRRHEKDFLLRNDMKYLDKFNAGIREFMNHLALCNGSGKCDQMKQLLRNYQQLFREVVRLQRQIGLTRNDGLMEEIERQEKAIKATLDKFSKAVLVASEQETRQNIILYALLFLVQIAVCLVLAKLLGKRFGRKVNEIRQALAQLARGEPIDQPVSEAGKDEIAQARQALQALSGRLTRIEEFATSVGKGNLQASLEGESRNGTLEQTLLVMQRELKKAREEEATRHWQAASQAALLQITRDATDREQLARLFLKKLITLLNCSLGGIFIREEAGEVPVLSMKACYAYDRQKYLKQMIPEGEGLIGQVFKEGKPQEMTEVPDNYLSITSGLGKASPRYLYLQPLVFKAERIGVMELASFTPFTEAGKTLVSKAGEALASTIVMNRMVENREGREVNEAAGTP